MKNQKRFVALLVCVVLFALCAVVLTSCGKCDHDYGEWVVTKEATCTTAGEAYRVCKLDSEHVETKVVEPAAHTYGEYVSDGKATCSTNGTKTAACTVCGNKNTVLENAKGHSFTTYTPSGDATCTTGAPETAVCDRDGCGATDVRYVGEALNHDYDGSGVCSRCSDVAPHLAKYDISKDGSSVIATVYETNETIGATKNIALLLKISGTGEAMDFASEDDAPWSDDYGKKILYVEVEDTVTSLGSYTFAGLDKLIDVKLSAALVGIPAFAFAECGGLVDIEIPASVTEFGEGAFVDCDALEEVIIEDGSVLTVVGKDAFNGCKYLEDINLPDGVSAICESAFEGCKNLEVLNVTDNITTFGRNAIKNTDIELTDEKGASYLKVGENAYAILVSIHVKTLEEGTLTVNKGTVIIPELVLLGYTSKATERIKSIVVEAENTVYSAIGNCIIKDGTVIMGIETSTIPEDASVTAIGKYAFYQCEGLVSVTIPSNITTIAAEAFYGAEDLKTVVMANSVSEIGEKAFAFCDKLESVTLSTGLDTIGTSVFAACTSLKSIIIPYGITSVATSAFEGCSDLKTVIFPASVERIEEKAFMGCGFEVLGLPNTIKYVGDYAFATCESVETLDLPDSAEYIGEGAFAGCTALTAIEIPATIGYIGKAVFYGCAGLETVSVYFTGSDASGTDSTSFSWIFAEDTAAMPKVKTVYILGDAPIAAGAFENCTSIETIHLSSGITKIDNGAFDGCTGLNGLYITDITLWCAVEFADYYSNPLYYAHNLYLNGSLVRELVIPEGVTTVSFAAFNGCESITSISLPSTLTTIETAAFKGCASLTEIALPNSVTAIGALAFANCGSLVDVTLSTGITELAPYVFSGCAQMLTISIPAGITSISETAFIGCQRLSEVVVDEANTAYVSYCGIVYTADKAIYFIPHSIAGKVVLLDGLTEIKTGAFLSSPHIDELVVPASVTNIGAAAFVGCTTLKSITLPFIGQSLDCTENAEFGYVFGTIPSTLTTVTILGGTKVVDGAFKNCESIGTVNLPEGMISIGKEAFANCAGLSTITLPKSVTSVADDAFAECKKLRTVYYGGADEDAFDAITVGINNTFLRSAKFYYFNDDTASAEGTGTSWYVDAAGEIVIW